MIEVFDKVILDFFQQLHNDVLTFILKFFTIIGEGGAVWIAVGLVMLFVLEDKKYGLIVLLSLFLCLIFGNGLLKHVVARPRPCWQHPEVPMLIAIPRDYSFPSGHTFASVAGAIGIYHWKHKFGYIAFAIAALIACSRMYFFVHYPTDIIGGVLLGTSLALISISIVEKMSERNKKLKHS